MEHLIHNLKENLIARKNNELARLQKYDVVSNKDLILISSGKIIELDQLISFIENMMNYYNQTKKISQ
ncbi:MAG TPA: hypothetical protein PKI01_12460 [Bacteroidales bacterium]|nr:hypothetical protein [Bacteroidales bacterium]